MRVHGPAYVEEQEDAQIRPALRPQRDLQLSSIARRLVDGGLDVQLVQRALAHEGPQPPQRDLDVAGVQRHVGSQVAEVPLSRELQRTATAWSIADLDPGRVGPGAPVRRGAARAHPAVSTVVPPALLQKPLPQSLARLS